MLGLLGPAVSSLHAARAADSVRARPAGEVSALAAEVLGVPVWAHGSVAEAVEAALGSGEPVLVTGSLYVVGEARSALGLASGG